MRIGRWLLDAVLAVLLIIAVASWLDARGDRNEAVGALQVAESEKLAVELEKEGLVVEWGEVRTDLLDSLAVTRAEVARLIEEANARPVALADVTTEAVDTVLVPVEVYRDSLAADFAGPPLWGRISYYPERYQFSLKWRWFDELRLLATRTSDGRYLLAAESATGDPRIRYSTGNFYIDPPKPPKVPRGTKWSCIGAAAGAGASLMKEWWIPAGVLGLSALWRCR